MTDILTNSASIPYGTWGGGRSLTQSKSISIPASNVPYTYSPLASNIYISIDMTDVKPIVYINNMAYYAENNISNYRNITEIPSGHLPANINTSLAQNWYRAFNNCRNLTSLPDPFYDTSNATNTSMMFFNCHNLTTVPNFDTSNVTDMSTMLGSCYNLTTVPNFNTSSVTSMSDMFMRCRNLTTIPNFDTSNVTDMGDMFRDCYNLTTVPNFDTSNVTDMGYMFNYCRNLTTVPNFDTSKVTNMINMFYGCNLTTIPTFDTSNVTDMYGMFAYCYNLTTVPNFNTSKVTNMINMFYGCNNLITIPTFDTSNVTDIHNMFLNCTNIRGDLYIESSNVSNARDLFENCTAYTKNIYCHANTTTYHTIYRNIGRNYYNSDWNAYLYTMENSYAVIPYTGNGIYRFPTNKIQIVLYNQNNINSCITNRIIEVSPYTDYELTFRLLAGPTYITHGTVNWGAFPTIVTGYKFGFRFFKDIPNMTADVVDII